MCYFGLVIRHSTLQHALFERGNRRHVQPGQTKNYLDGEHNRVVRIWLCEDSREGTRHKLLATTHCIRPSNGWNLTKTKTHTNHEIITIEEVRSLLDTMDEQNTYLLENCERKSQMYL